MKRTVVITLTLAVLICASAAWCQGPPGPGGPGGFRGGRGPGMPCAMTAVMPPVGILQHGAEALGLTADQIKQLKDLAQNGDATMPPLMKAVGESCKAFRDALVASEFDTEAVAKLAATAESNEAAVVTARIAEWAQIRTILTADQITKLQEMMSLPPPGPGGPGGPPPGGAPPPPPPPQ